MSQTLESAIFKIVFIAFVIVFFTACASSTEAASWKVNRHGPQCLNGQQQFVGCP